MGLRLALASICASVSPMYPCRCCTIAHGICWRWAALAMLSASSVSSNNGYTFFFFCF